MVAGYDEYSLIDSFTTRTLRDVQNTQLLEIFKMQPKIVAMLPQKTPKLFLFSHWLLN